MHVCMCKIIDYISNNNSTQYTSISNVTSQVQDIVLSFTNTTDEVMWLLSIKYTMCSFTPSSLRRMVLSIYRRVYLHKVDFTKI